jgi:hypothetical protein
MVCSSAVCSLQPCDDTQASSFYALCSETPAIDVCKGLIRDGARVAIYDPKVFEKCLKNC